MTAATKQFAAWLVSPKYCPLPFAKKLEKKEFDASIKDGIEH
jgi:hypothetical protein